jgi:hypothetical protein
MEIIEPSKDLVEKPKPIEEEVDKFHLRWRNSEFYSYVMKIVSDEMERKYLQEIMEKRYLDGESLSNEEIGEQARIDFQAGIRIRNGILEVLK